MDEELLDAPLSTRLTLDEKNALLANAQAMGSTKDIVLRSLVRAFNQYCKGGVRPAFPLEISGPGYIVNEGRVEDRSVIVKGLGTAGEVHNQEQEKKYGPGQLRLPVAEAQAEQQLKRNLRKRAGVAAADTPPTAHPSSSRKRS